MLIEFFFFAVILLVSLTAVALSFGLSCCPWQVKNVQSVLLGKFEVETWYFSPYPDDYSKLDKVRPIDVKIDNKIPLDRKNAISFRGARRLVGCGLVTM